MYRSLVVPLAFFIGLPACTAGEIAPMPRGTHALPNKASPAAANPAALKSFAGPNRLPEPPNGTGIKDPKAFAEWLETMAEPRMMTALGAAATPLGPSPRLATNAIDPGTIRNWAEFTDPYLFMRWALAGGTPAFRLAIDSRTSEAGTPNGMNPPAGAAGCGAFAGMIRFAPIRWSGGFVGRAGQPAEAGVDGWLRLHPAGEAVAASARHRF